MQLGAPPLGGAAFPRIVSRMPDDFQIPGFVDAHSHAFQRALRGTAEGRDFWAWRELMLEAAAAQTPAGVRTEYEQVYADMLAAGYTAVGEFHYLGLAEARAAAEAAAAAGIELVLLYVAYARGGIERFRQASVADYLHELEELRDAGVRVGVAPHSVRACPRDWLVELARYAAQHELPLHVHADEQPREIEECVAEHGLRPIELLAACGCLGRRTTVVHATHADGRELDLLGQAGARVCACPTTEANLGDGFLPVERLLHRGIGICIGSDSNVRIDPFEELRELDGIARRQSGRRDVFTVDALLSIGSDEGAARSASPTGRRSDRRRPSAAPRRRRAAVRARRRVLGRRRQAGNAPLNRGFRVGAPRFELGTSSPPDWRANQAAPRPVWLSVANRGQPSRIRRSGLPAPNTSCKLETRFSTIRSEHIRPLFATADNSDRPWRPAQIGASTRVRQDTIAASTFPTFVASLSVRSFG